MSAESAPGPLDGVRVLEFTQVVAGPFAGRVLGDLGAQVVKVEPPGGEPYRNRGTVVPNEGKRFQSLNRGKQSLVVDLQQEAGQQLIQRIIREFDVVLINYREGVSQRLGIDYPTLSEGHPRLIYCRMTGFGVHSTAAQRPATDPMMQAYSGLMVAAGKVGEDGLPLPLGATAIADYITGLSGVAAICAAIYHRQLSGRGQLIDASLLRSALNVQDTTVMREPVTDVTIRDHIVAEVQAVRDRDGSYAEMIQARERARDETTTLRLYSGAYQAKDGAIMLGSLTPASREAARRVLGVVDEMSEGPIEDPSAPEFLAQMQDIRRQIEETIRQRTVSEWIDAFEAGGAPAAPVNFPEEMSDDSLVQAEGIMVDFVHEVTGPQRVVGPLFELSETPAVARVPSPPLGGHTDDVLTACGLSDQEIAVLRSAGVVH